MRFRARLAKALRVLFDVEPPAEAPPPLPRFYAPLGPDRGLTQIYDGQYLYVDPRDEQVASHLISRGYWEMWVTKVVLSLIRPGDRIIEVGANLAYYTVLMGRQTGPQGRIDSFEANPHLAQLSQASAVFNGQGSWVKVHPQAASNTSGTIQFVTSFSQAGGGHLLKGSGGLRPGEFTIEAPCVRLDDVIREGAIDLIRMDAEGSEPLILDGAEQIIARSPNLCIVLEWDVVMISARADIHEFLDRLEAAGFQAWLIMFDSTLEPITREQLLERAHDDIVLCRTHPYART